jgi:hypothetical protein
LLRSLSAPADGDADNLAVGHDVRADCAPAASKKRKVDSSSDGVVGPIADAKAQRKAFEMVALFPTLPVLSTAPSRFDRRAMHHRMRLPCRMGCHVVWDITSNGTERDASWQSEAEADPTALWAVVAGVAGAASA